MCIGRRADVRPASIAGPASLTTSIAASLWPGASSATGHRSTARLRGRSSYAGVARCCWAPVDACRHGRCGEAADDARRAPGGLQRTAGCIHTWPTPAATSSDPVSPAISTGAAGPRAAATPIAAYSALRPGARDCTFVDAASYVPSDTPRPSPVPADRWPVPPRRRRSPGPCSPSPLFLSRASATNH